MAARHHLLPDEAAFMKTQRVEMLQPIFQRKAALRRHLACAFRHAEPQPMAAPGSRMGCRIGRRWGGRALRDLLHPAPAERRMARIGAGGGRHRLAAPGRRNADRLIANLHRAPQAIEHERAPQRLRTAPLAIQIDGAAARPPEKKIIAHAPLRGEQHAIKRARRAQFGDVGADDILQEICRIAPAHRQHAAGQKTGGRDRRFCHFVCFGV